MAKKAAELPPLSETLVEPDANDPEATTLELDELWSFVLQNLRECGFGLRSVERYDKLLHELWVTEARRLAVNCGMPFQKTLALDSVLLISGMLIKESFQKSSRAQWVRRQVELFMSSVGTTSFASVLADSFAKRSRSPHLC